MAGLRVYPNPVGDVLYVETSEAQPSAYRITNVLGQTLMDGVLNATEIDVAHLPDGLYFITVNGLISKFVKTSTLK